MEAPLQQIGLEAIRIVLILLVAWGVQWALSRGLDRLERRLTDKGTAAGEPPTESAKRATTLIRLVRQAAMIGLWIVVGLIMLDQVGVDIGPILAAAGILGLAVGFGAQNLVRDVISGFFIIMENQVRLGDVALVNGTGGLVEAINFRTLVLRDLSGTVHIFPNGTITTLSNMTTSWSGYVFDIGVAYKEDVDRVIEVIKSVGAVLREDEYFGPLILEDVEVFGVNAFADSAVMIKGRLKTKPIRQWEVGREFLRRVKHAFDEAGIEIPFPHRSLYFGSASEPMLARLVEESGRTAEAGS